MLIETSISTLYEYDIACVLYEMYKNKYKFVGGEWYIYECEKWQTPDVSQSLFQKIRTELYSIYVCHQNNCLDVLLKLSYHSETDNSAKYTRYRLKQLCLLLIKMLDRSDSIISEASILFTNTLLENTLLDKV